jgi:DNA-binding GntR family transcriptional regulator
MRLAPDRIAGHLGVSAMPVREALIALTHESLVEALPRRGFRVARLRIRDVEHTFRVHAQIAGLLAEEAAAVIDDGEIAALREIQRRIDAASQDPLTAKAAQQIDELNLEFHRFINRVSDAPRLRWFLRAATGYVARELYKDNPAWYSAAVLGHAAIVDALAAHDGAAARSLIESHVLRSGRVLVEALASRTPWALASDSAKAQTVSHR